MKIIKIEYSDHCSEVRIDSNKDAISAYLAQIEGLMYRSQRQCRVTLLENDFVKAKTEIIP